MYSKFGQFIDGKWQLSTNKETYDVINPATEEIIGKASKASSADVDKALKSAEKGFEVWKKIKPWERSKIIRKIADEIRKKSKVFARWMTLETGKTLAEGEAEASALLQIFLNGMLRRPKEFMVNHYKADLIIQKFKSSTNLWVLLQHYHHGIFH